MSFSSRTLRGPAYCTTFHRHTHTHPLAHSLSLSHSPLGGTASKIDSVQSRRDTASRVVACVVLVTYEARS